MDGNNKIMQNAQMYYAVVISQEDDTLSENVCVCMKTERYDKAFIC